MKRNALVAFGLLVSLVSAGAVFGKEVKQGNTFSLVQVFGITVEQARKNALKKVPGEIEDEYTLEDEDGNLTAYVFVIKATSTGKTFEVQIDAENGNVLAAEEQKEEEESTEEEEEESEEQESEEEETTTPEETTEEETETDETESPKTESDDDNDEVSMKDEVNKNVSFKVSMEQARAKATKKVKGEIQSETLVTNNGKAYYAFVIKDKKNKTTEVRVDANSGKAIQMKAAKSE